MKQMTLFLFFISPLRHLNALSLLFLSICRFVLEFSRSTTTSPGCRDDKLVLPHAKTLDNSAIHALGGDDPGGEEDNELRVGLLLPNMRGFLHPAVQEYPKPTSTVKLRNFIIWWWFVSENFRCLM